jgi:(p)ppGpp synthase/HD superfamily hydrolase
VSGPLARAAAAFALGRQGVESAVHPAEVGALLAAAGEDDAIVAAGLLHDVVEDTDTTEAEIAERAGPRVASLVAALTEDPGIPDYAARKADLRRKIAAGGRDAAVVSAADKLSKVRALARTGAHVPEAKAEHYDRTLAIVTTGAPGHPLAVALREEWSAIRGARVPCDSGDPSR